MKLLLGIASILAVSTVDCRGQLRREAPDGPQQVKEEPAIIADGPQEHQGPKLEEHQKGIQQRKPTLSCRKFGGRCVPGRKACPDHLPLYTPLGAPFCPKKKRCCYQDECFSLWPPGFWVPAAFGAPNCTHYGLIPTGIVRPGGQCCQSNSVAPTSEAPVPSLDKCTKATTKSCSNLLGTCQSSKTKCNGKVYQGKKYCKDKGCVCCVKKKGQECVLNLSDVTFPPIILNYKTGSIILPHKKIWEQQIISVDNGIVLTIGCSGTKLNDFNETAIEARCNNGNLRVGTTDYTMKNMGCDEAIKSSIRRDQGNCSHDNKTGYLSEIGFETFPNQFYSQIKVCFGVSPNTTLWTEHTLYGLNIAARVSSDRPNFTYDEGFFLVNAAEMEICYNLTAQKKLLASKGINIDLNNQDRFSRGHLSPRGDFVTNAESVATFHYINALPQWQRFNGGNWEKLERNIVDNLAKNRTIDLRIITGGANILELNNEVKIFLGETPYVNKTAVPVPAYFWKVVFHESIDSNENKAVGFFGFNTPYLKKAPGEPRCETSCKDITWVDFDNTNLKDGLTYCCTIAELRKIVPNIPEDIKDDLPLLK